MRQTFVDRINQVKTGCFPVDFYTTCLLFRVTGVAPCWPLKEPAGLNHFHFPDYEAMFTLLKQHVLVRTQTLFLKNDSALQMLKKKLKC